eukprot:5477551-Amphidinium_carterae.1
MATRPCKVLRRMSMHQDTLHGNKLSQDLALMCAGKLPYHFVVSPDPKHCCSEGGVLQQNL